MSEYECPKCGAWIREYEGQPLFCGECHYDEGENDDEGVDSPEHQIAPGHVLEKTSFGWSLRKLDS